MPKYQLTTIERWEHKVDYPLIEAATIEKAWEQIQSGQHSYDDQEIIEGGDEYVRVWEVTNEYGNTVSVPPELEKEPPAAARIAVIVEGGLVQDIVTDYRQFIGITAIVIDYDVEGSTEDERTIVTQSDGTKEPTYCSLRQVSHSDIDLSAVVADLAATP